MDNDRRNALLIGLAVIVAVLGVVTAIVLTTGDDDKEPEAAAPTTTTTSTTAPAVTEPAVTEVAAEVTDLEDGRHPAFLTALDVEGRTVEVDVIQFLTGEDARVAYEEETGDPGGPPDDYYIKNENARLRTLPLAADVPVTISPEGRPRSIALADLPAQLATGPADANGKVWYDPFWLTVEDGQVTAMEEQFLP